MTDEEYYTIIGFSGNNVCLGRRAHQDAYYTIEDKVNLREFVADDEFEYFEVSEIK